MFAGLLRMKRWLPRLRAARPAGGREGFGQRLQRRLVRRLVTPRWLRHLTRILEQEKDVAAVLVLTVPLNHLCGIPTALRERFGVPVIYYDGDLPASLPGFGGFGTGFSIYHGADISEYDAVLSNSQGATEDVRRLGARQTEVVWWGADPNVFRPADEDEEDIDVFFYGLGDGVSGRVAARYDRRAESRAAEAAFRGCRFAAGHRPGPGGARRTGADGGTQSASKTVAIEPECGPRRSCVGVCLGDDAAVRAGRDGPSDCFQSAARFARVV